MQLRLLKDKLSDSERLFEKFENPEALKEKLSLPDDATDELNKYSRAYYSLSDLHNELRELINQAEAKDISDDKEISIDRRKFNLTALELSLGQLHAKLQLVGFSQKMDDKNSVAVIKDKTEIILLTNDTMSDELIDRTDKQTQDILKIVNTPFDQGKMSHGLSDINLDSLESSGCSTGHRRDYARNAYFFDSDQKLVCEKPTGDYFIDDLEPIVQAFIKSNELLPEQAPNIRAMLTNLLYQGGLPGYLEIFSSKEFFQLGLLEQEGSGDASFSFNHFGRQSLASAFFDSETGKIHIEACLEKNGCINPANVEHLTTEEKKILSQELQKIKVIERISVDISVDNEKKMLASKPQFSVAISRPQKIARKFPIFIAKATVKEGFTTQPVRMDDLRPCLEDLAKFAGYDSLQALFYSAPEEGKSQLNAEIQAKLKAIHAKFTLGFIKNHLQSIPEVDRQFFEELYHSFYIDRKTSAELSKTIFNFVNKRLSEVPSDEKIRYIYLFKMSVRLLNLDSKKEIEQKKEALDVLIKSTLPKMQHQDDEFAKGNYEADYNFLFHLYDSLYMGEATEAEAKQTITDWVAYKLNTNQFSNNSMLVDYYINFAVDQQVKIPEGFDSKAIIDYLWKRDDKEKSLFMAAQLNFSVYQELIKPLPKPSFWRRIGEFFGWVSSRPNVNFTDEQKVQLMGVHHSKLAKQNNPDEYLTQLNQLTLENKLYFLTGYHQTKNNDLTSLPESFWADLEYELLDNSVQLKANLPLFQALIAQANSDRSNYFFTNLYGVFENIVLNYPDTSVKANQMFLNTLTPDEKVTFFYKFMIEKSKKSKDLEHFGDDFFASWHDIQLSRENLMHLSSILLKLSTDFMGRWINKMPDFFMSLFQADDFSVICKLRLLNLIQLNDFNDFNDFNNLGKKVWEELGKSDKNNQTSIQIYIGNLMNDENKALVVRNQMPSLVKWILIQQPHLLYRPENIAFLCELSLNEQVDFLNQYLEKQGVKTLDVLNDFLNSIQEKLQQVDREVLLNQLNRLTQLNDINVFLAMFNKMPSLFLKIANQYSEDLLLNQQLMFLKAVEATQNSNQTIAFDKLGKDFFEKIKGELANDPNSITAREKFELLRICSQNASLADLVPIFFSHVKLAFPDNQNEFTPQEKFHWFCWYAIYGQPGETEGLINTLQKRNPSNTFFTDLDQGMVSVYQLNSSIYNSLFDDLLLNGKPSDINSIRKKLPSIFSLYVEEHFSESADSIKERLEWLVKLPVTESAEETLSRFGSLFFTKLSDNLNQLAINIDLGISEKSQTLEEICQLLKDPKNPWLVMLSQLDDVKKMLHSEENKTYQLPQNKMPMDQYDESELLWGIKESGDSVNRNLNQLEKRVELLERRDQSELDNVKLENNEENKPKI